MKKTQQMIDDFFSQIEKDKELAESKIKELEQQRDNLDIERSEISKALIRYENSGDKEAAKKLNAELLKRVNEVGVLNNKIEAYKEMGCRYEAEAERILACAAQEYNEDHQKELKAAQDEVAKARKKLEEAQEMVKACEKILDKKKAEEYSVKYNAKCLLDNQLPNVIKYLPQDTLPLEPNVYEYVDVKMPGGISHDRVCKENYGEGMEGKIIYYYEKVLHGENKEVKPKRKSIVDVLLGR